MRPELKAVDKKDKSILKQLLELYCYDFSEFLNTDVEMDGCYHYKYLDHYFVEDGRHAFFIIVDDKMAGFILINKDLKIAEAGYSIAEFFVLKKYRNEGIGKEAATIAFNQFKGPWEVSVITINQPATLFWQKVVDQFTNGKFDLTTQMYNNREKIFLTFQS